MSERASISTERESAGLDLDRVLVQVARRSGPICFTGLRGAARAVVAARLVRDHGDRPVLLLAPNAKAADALLQDLRTALGETAGAPDARVRAFPRHDSAPYDRFSPQPFVTAQRMDVLYRWLACPAPTATDGGRAARAGDPAPVVVAPWTALVARVPARSVVRARSVHLEVGMTVDRDALVETLLAAGYSRLPLVEEPGELAVRGGIVDLFPPQRVHPLRVEFLGDEVESIRDFDPASQRSAGTLGHAVAAPPRELLFDRSLVVERADAIRELAQKQGAPPAVVDDLVDALLRGHIPPGAEALAPLLQPDVESPIDFLPADTLIVVDEAAAGRERLLQYSDEILTNFDAASGNERVVAPPDQLFEHTDELVAAIESRKPVIFDRLGVDAHAFGDRAYSVRAYPNDELVRDLVRARTGDAALQPLIDRLDAWKAQRWRVVLAVPSLSGAERLRTLLDEYGTGANLASEPRPAWRWGRPGQLEVRIAEISAGFALPIESLAVVTEEEIFGPRQRRRSRPAFREGAVIEALAQLSTGDALVHAEHGIGIYRGLVNLDLGGAAGEFLRLEYERGDRLFLPVHRLNLVQRYVGADGHVPRIDRLGGATWERAKSSVKRSLRVMAEDLLKVQAARELAPGFAYSARDRYMEEFEASFPYEETPDQLSAIEDVLADLARPKPMDRLVCGDVGYGKTEVAVRAAFRAVMDGKQVAVLVPTTVLAHQHEETFRARLDGYPVRVASYSRFCTPKQAAAVLEGLASGTIDIVIGTHRLLQKKVRFRDLGLLVVDEEQRFGVSHKEQIKRLRKTVDVVTLTATPIPRTLQMAFTGLRELSVINTPPADRLSIRTRVCRFSESLIREAILREVRRGGQVFFVHNRVRSIGGIAEMLERMVPEVKFVVAHGQLPEHQLEERMLTFVRGEADVLVCTTIIESGLDVSRANTILIDRANALGLAQLYQLRGRVGRSSHRAYAYLLVASEEGLGDDAERRLEAIQDLSELGSGFRLANMDLEIRGAGNLLGAEQSGNLAAVGYETYMEMLNETIEELRGNLHEREVDPEIRLPVPARLPEDYVPEVSQRLVLYKRLASSRDDADIDRVRDEILDRFGPLPAPAQHLLEVIRLKVIARSLGVAAVELVRGEFVLSAGESTRIEPQRLVNLLNQAGSGIRVTPDHKIYAPAGSHDAADLLARAKILLVQLGGKAKEFQSVSI